MENVLPRTQDVIQEEILTLNGHQKWHRVTVHDFGDNNIEVSLRPYETWSEVTEEDLDRPLTERGAGDREKSSESAARRAKRQVRHKCKLLKAKYMITLTTREVITDLDVMQRYFQEFVRRIRKVQNFEYVATHEFQKRGALHLHIAVAHRQDFKLLWAIWRGIMGVDNARVYVSSGAKKVDTNKIAAYLSKYITKDFLEGDLNRKRYWASRGIGKPDSKFYLLRHDWDIAEVIKFIIELCDDYGVKFLSGGCWQNLEDGLFWMSASDDDSAYQRYCDERFEKMHM